MIALLASLALKFGVPQRFAKAAGIGLAIVALLALLAILKSCYDSSLIEQHEAEQRAANAEADRKANEDAARQRREDDARQANEARELERIRENAKGLSDTERRVARQRCIRLQQQARAAGRQPPRC